MGMKNENPAGTLIGYARVSTEDQKLDLQVDALVKAGVDPANIYQEHASGADAKRGGLRRALLRCGPGDTLVVWRLDRLARDLKALLRISGQLKDETVGLRSLTEALDTTSAAGMFLFHILGVVAEFERQLGRERTKAGVRLRQERGEPHGRPREVGCDEIQEAVRLMTVEGMSMKQAAAKLDRPLTTLQTYFPGGRGAVIEQWEASKRKPGSKNKRKARRKR